MALTVAVSAGLVAALGRSAALASLVAGLMATVVEWASLRSLRRGQQGGTREFLAGFTASAIYKLIGILVFAALVLVNRSLFPPLPTGLGFLGVLIPLLFFEVRLAQ
ncbi:MAG: hypothetical protein ABJC74_17840 [Gemmatimonadota bacterium]